MVMELIPAMVELIFQVEHDILAAPDVFIIQTGHHLPGKPICEAFSANMLMP